MKKLMEQGRCRIHTEWPGNIHKMMSFSSILSGRFLSTALAVTAAGLLTASGVQAALTYEGNFYPNTPNTWTSTTAGRVGNSGSASLTVDDKFVLASGNSYLGYAATATGSATVTGSDSTWTSSKVRYVGYNGTGVLNITNGGKVSNSSGYLGYNTGSTGTATVDGSGSALTASDAHTIGRSGTGILNITNGGIVSNTNGTIGGNAGSTGTVTVDGIRSRWINNGNLTVSNNGTGVLNILNDSAVSVTGKTSVGTLGTINFGSTGGTLTTGMLNASSSQLTGTGTINTNGWSELGNYDLLFDSTHGLNQTLTVSDTSRNLTVNYDLSGSSGTVADTYVGYSKNGSLTIKDGLAVKSANGYVGYAKGFSGIVNVDGAGSAWNLTGSLNVGPAGTGSLNITNGSSVNVAGTLYASPSQISGNGTVNASGIVSDINLIFNATHGATQSIAMNGVTLNLNQSNSGALGVGYLGSGTLTIADGVNIASNGGYIGYQSGSTGTATVAGTGTKWTDSGDLAVGNYGTGALAISNGAIVTNGISTIGNNAGSRGNVTVNGSTWANSGTLTVGNYGDGVLNIANGGTVTNGNVAYIGNNTGGSGTVNIDGAGSTWTVNSYALYLGYSAGSKGAINITNGGWVNNGVDGYIGYNAGSTGTATVSGKGSSWVNGNALYVGKLGTGKLSVSGSGLVTAASVSINSSSLLTTDVGSKLTAGAGSGTITNNGTIRLAAGAGAGAGTYTPMSYGTMDGTGSVQALGGVWDKTNHTVTVSDAEIALSGRAKTIDLSTTQRVLFVDAASAQVAGASFAGTTDSTNLTVTGTCVETGALSLLQGSLAAGESALSAWEFVAGQGYVSGSPVYLSLEVGSGYDLSNLDLWSYDGSTWSALDAYDLAYDGTYASFTATDLGSWAVTGTSPVPVPGAVWLLGSGLLGVLGFRKRNGVKA